MTTTAHEDESDRPQRARRPWHRTKVAVGLVLLVTAVVAIIGALTPWPSAMLIRAVFTKGGDETAAEMDKHVPDTTLTEQLDVAYADGGADTTMDVFTPASASGPLPTVVWIHGGAWISGSKENVDPYMRILAAEGYTTIAVNYTIGPEGVYPLAVHQLNDALAYIDEHADELGVDPNQIVLAGDSAGGQLASNAGLSQSEAAGLSLTEIAQAKFNRDAGFSQHAQPVSEASTDARGNLARAAGLSADAAEGLSLGQIAAVKFSRGSSDNDQIRPADLGATVATRSLDSRARAQLISNAGLTADDATGLSLTEIAAAKFDRDNQ